jgi:hypothetical protein
LIALIRECSFDAQEAINATSQQSRNVFQGEVLVEHSRRRPVCTENLNPDVMVMQAAQERV